MHNKKYRPIALILIALLLALTTSKSFSQSYYIKQFSEIAGIRITKQYNDSIFIFGAVNKDDSTGSIIFYNINSGNYLTKVIPVIPMWLLFSGDTIFYCGAVTYDFVAVQAVFGYVMMSGSGTRLVPIGNMWLSIAQYFNKTGNYYFSVGGYGISGHIVSYYYKFDQNGNFIDSTQLTNDGFARIWTVIDDANKNVFLAGDGHGNYITMVDSNGHEHFTAFYYYDTNYVFTNSIKLWGNKILLCGNMTNYSTNNDGALLRVTDSIGHRIKDYIIGSVPHLVITNGYDVYVDGDTAFVLAGTIASPASGYLDNFYLARFDLAGNIVWQRTYPAPPDAQWTPQTLSRLSDGYLIAGQGYIDHPNLQNINIQAILIKTDLQGKLYSSSIFGNVSYYDNCDSIKTALPNRLVVASSPQQSYYGITDNTGLYSIDADTGVYKIYPFLNSILEDTCRTFMVSLLQNDTAIVDSLGINVADNCPIVTLNLTSSCFGFVPSDSAYYILNCKNIGTAGASNLTFDLYIDTFIKVLSSEIPLNNLGENHYTFSLNQLPVTADSSYKIVAQVDSTAPLGWYHLSRVSMRGDTICEGILSEHSVIKCYAACLNDSILFTARNVGAGMADSTVFNIYENDSLLLTGKLRLTNNESFVIQLPSHHGNFYRVEAVQEFYPILTNAWSFVEYANIWACDSANPYSVKYLNNYPENCFDAYAEDIKQNVFAFDPNSKSAVPKGFEEQNYILQGGDIEYTIHFQNTGTASASSVFIVDTLSQFLDLNYFDVISSSHKYNFSFAGSNILKFDFPGINLPDSGHSQLNSNGFIKFRLRIKPNAAPNSLVQNTAYIYFDLNAPVITNSTQHTVYYIPGLQTGISDHTFSASSVYLFPNPATDAAYLNSPEDGTITFIDIIGQQEGSFKIKTGLNMLDVFSIPKGVTIYSIHFNKGIEVKGKIILN